MVLFVINIICGFWAFISFIYAMYVFFQICVAIYSVSEGEIFVKKYIFDEKTKIPGEHISDLLWAIILTAILVIDILLLSMFVNYAYAPFYP